MANVGLVFGGRSVEHRVSVTSARTIAEGLTGAAHQVVPLGVSTAGDWVGLERSQAALDGEVDALDPVGDGLIRPTALNLLGAEIDVVFPIIHGTWGEDGSLQGLCEMLDLPYVGTGLASSAVAMDKILAKSVLSVRGIPVVDWVDLDRGAWARERRVPGVEELAWPVFVKPAIGGSSVGVARVEHREDLATAIDDALRFDDRVLVESGIPGREIECAVLGLEELQPSVLGEIVPGNDFYDYSDKYLDDGAALLAPAELSAERTAELRGAAVEAFAALGGWGMARVDFLVTDEAWWVNEINTLPGFTSISMFPRLWALTGVPLAELTDRLVEIALQRHEARTGLDRGIRDWIASLKA